MPKYTFLAILVFALLALPGCTITFSAPSFAGGDSDGNEDDADGDMTVDGDLPANGDAPDGDSPTDGDIPDGDDPACTPDSYACRDDTTVLRCSAQGVWLTYRDCPDTERCVDGACETIPPDGDALDGDSPDGDEPDGDEPDGDDPACVPCEEDADCLTGAGQYCLKNPADGADGCCRLPCEAWQENCPGGYDCVANRCTPNEWYCESHWDCVGGEDGEDYYCHLNEDRLDGGCHLGCTSQWAACPNHSQCQTDIDQPDYMRCVPDANFCVYDSDCEWNEVCRSSASGLAGRCLPNCLFDGDFCPEGTRCADDPERDGKYYALCVPIDPVSPNGCISQGECASGSYCQIPEYSLVGDCKPLCTREDKLCADDERCIDDPNDPLYGFCAKTEENCVVCHERFSCPYGREVNATGSYCEIRERGGCCRYDCQVDAHCDSGDICDCYGRCIWPDLEDCRVMGCLYPEWICDPCSGECEPPGECLNPQACGYGLQPCCPGYQCSAVVYGLVGYCI